MNIKSSIYLVAKKSIVFITVTFFLFNYHLNAQSNNYLRLTLSAGISKPQQEFNSTNMFAGTGLIYSGSLDYFWSKIGIGIDAGFFTNETKVEFQNFINVTYLNSTEFPTMNKWETKYALLGPTFNTQIKKLQIGIFAKAGYSQISVPELAFNKPFFGQTYNIYQFYGATPDYQMAWMGGINLGFKINNWLGVIGRASYFSTSYMSNIAYTNIFRDASDSNRNGILEDDEYLESIKITSPGSIALSAFNPTLGIQLTLGKSTPRVPTAMTSDFLPIIETMPDVEIVQTEKPREIRSVSDPIITEEVITVPIEEKTIPGIADVTASNPVPTEDKGTTSEIENKITSNPLVNSVAESDKTVNAELSNNELFDAPEATYDTEAASLLYKAGESYFAANDFENAIPCFNKLKANSDYPRAAYMFALSLSAMGNCLEAKSEFNKFNNLYLGEDKRTLEIIFASQLERCKSNSSTRGSSEVKPTTITKKYTIQFIAIKKPNKNFPKLSSIGNIETEFFPNKSVYRYILGEYSDIESARADVAKVKKMGFRDAFIAEYENDVRINTLDHYK